MQVIYTLNFARNHGFKRQRLYLKFSWRQFRLDTKFWGRDRVRYRPYSSECEPSASSDENGGGLEEEEVDEDGLSVATLEQRIDKTVPVSAWYVKILLCFVMNDSECILYYV